MRLGRLIPVFFFGGFFGATAFLFLWLRSNNSVFRTGFEISIGFMMWGIGEAILATWRDVKSSRRSSVTAHLKHQQNVIVPRPLLKDPYFRAGIFGLPFCLAEWFWKHQAVFLLGAGFFAGLLTATLYGKWRELRKSVSPVRIDSRENL